MPLGQHPPAGNLGSPVCPAHVWRGPGHSLELGTIPACCNCSDHLLLPRGPLWEGGPGGPRPGRQADAVPPCPHTTQAVCPTASADNGLSRLASGEGTVPSDTLSDAPVRVTGGDGLVKCSHCASLPPGPFHPGRWLPGGDVPRAICHPGCSPPHSTWPPTALLAAPSSRVCYILAAAQVGAHPLQRAGAE